MDTSYFSASELMIAGVVIIAAAIFATREIYSIPRQIRNLEAQTRVLYLIAAKLGVDPEELKDVDPVFLESPQEVKPPVQDDYDDL